MYNISVRSSNRLGQSHQSTFLTVQTDDVPIRRESNWSIEQINVYHSSRILKIYRTLNLQRWFLEREKFIIESKMRVSPIWNYHYVFESKSIMKHISVHGWSHRLAFSPLININSIELKTFHCVSIFTINFVVQQSHWSWVNQLFFFVNKMRGIYSNFTHFRKWNINQLDFHIDRFCYDGFMFNTVRFGYLLLRFTTKTTTT